MLDLLIEYARSHDLTTEPGLKPKDIRWVVVCDAQGGVSDVMEIGNPDEKRNRGRTFLQCPHLSQPEIKRGGAGCRHFLVDNTAVVALYNVETDDQKTRVKHDFFAKLLRRASAVMPELGNAATILQSPELIDQIQRILREKNAKATDNMTFAMVGRDPMFFVEDPTWHDWWRNFRQSLGRAEKPTKRTGEVESRIGTKRMRCFASGELVEPTPTHPKIDGLAQVGGISMGDALASYKQDAFCSYGLRQSANAAVSEEMAAAYRAALNDLLRRHSHRLVGAKVVHWYSGTVEVPPERDPIKLVEGDLDFLGEGVDRDEEESDAQHRAKELLDALNTGKIPNLLNYSYYALVLSGAAGRVMVRDWMQGPFRELIEAVDDWFSAIEIVRHDGVEMATTPGIERLIECLLPPKKSTQKYSDWIARMGGERVALWNAALRPCARIPHVVLARVVSMNKPYQGTAALEEAIEVLRRRGQSNKKDARNVISILHERMALIKAYHARKGDPYMAPRLNKDHPSPAYQCGRLMAVLADLQRAALGNVGASVVERYYAAASTTPALVIGRLVRLSQFHLGSLRSEKPGLAHWFETGMAEILDAVRAFPRTLNLEEQSLFALGYYQQKAAGKARSDGASNADAGHDKEKNDV